MGKYGKFLFPFATGIIAGVAGVFVYQVWGRPTLPSYTMDVIDSETVEWIAHKLNEIRASLEKTRPIKITPYKCIFCGDFIEANGYSRICPKCVTPSR